MERLRRKIYSILERALRKERTRQLNQENKLRVYDVEVTVSWDEDYTPTVHCQWGCGSFVRRYAGDAVERGLREISKDSIVKAVHEILKSCKENTCEEREFQKRMSGE